MVRAIKPNGRLKIDLIGGFGYSSIEGENCLVHPFRKPSERFQVRS